MPVTLDPAVQAGMQRLRDEPAEWMTDWLGVDLWEKQVEIAESVRDHRRTAVKSCHGSGKSFLAARIVLWFLHAYPASIVLTTAPTNNQVKNILWRQIGAAAAATRKPLLGRPLTMTYDIAPDWYALGFKADDTAPDRFQGFHAEYALVVIDEAAGVVPPVFHALNAVMTSEKARMLLIGNPTAPSGTFYDAFHHARELYNCITIAAEDTPNLRAMQTVRPYLITQQWIDDAITEHGKDSPYVRSRVFAEFPGVGDDTLIPLVWIEKARHADTDDRDGPVIAGLDVARMGGDENALCIRRGSAIVEMQTWTGVDTMATVGRVKSILANYTAIEAVNVDVIGVGAGVADRLREDRYPVVDVNVASRSSDPEKWSNLRHELWWNLRERFREGTIGGQLDETTVGQLASIKYRYDSQHSHPVIESKDQAKKRGIRSPDRAESVLLAFARLPPEDDDQSVLAFGSASGWGYGDGGRRRR